jgi:hypothetical protein
MKTTYADGDVYAASDVNDITGTINLLGSSVAYAAGKNKIINGNFGVWQRGTSFTTNGAYTADRFQMVTTASQGTVSQQTFTPGTAPVAGYEGQFFIRYNATASNLDPRLLQNIEDVRTFAGQTVTVSFWAKSATSNALNSISLRQNFGSGGSALVDITITPGFTLTSSWVRYSRTVTVPSISGKTIGAGSYLRLTFDFEDSTAFDFDLWGVQVEAGSTATAFQTATGTIQGELAACQRYYIRYANVGFQATPLNFGGTNSAYVYVPGLNQMRATPSTATTYANASYNTAIGAGQWALGVDGTGYATKTGTITVNLRNAGVSFTGATFSATPPNFLLGADSTLYIEASAEL